MLARNGLITANPLDVAIAEGEAWDKEWGVGPPDVEEEQPWKDEIEAAAAELEEIERLQPKNPRGSGSI